LLTKHNIGLVFCSEEIQLLFMILFSCLPDNLCDARIEIALAFVKQPDRFDQIFRFASKKFTAALVDISIVHVSIERQEAFIDPSNDMGNFDIGCPLRFYSFGLRMNSETVKRDL
jgi:hypothetical protein